MNSVSYLRQINSCLQVVYTVSYLRRDDCGCWGILCQLHDAGWKLSARVRVLRRLLIKFNDCQQQVHSVSYIKQVGGFLEKEV